MAQLLVGIDIGTSACKLAVFSPEGEVIAAASKSYPTCYPNPSWVEQSPLDWWTAVCSAMRECIETGGINPDDIIAIGVDGQSWATVALDAGGTVLCDTPIWMDTRSKDVCRKVLDRIDPKKIFGISGNPFEPTYSTPKILWFKENKPEIYHNTNVFLQSNSYIVYKLTGSISQDMSQGYGLHVYNINTGCYDSGLASELGIDIEKLPPIHKSSDVIGAVTSAAAAETGLNEGTLVVAGGLDAACGTLGAGVYLPGQTQEQGGQAGGMSICMGRPLSHEKLILSNHVIDGLWLLQGGTVGGGGTLNWFNRELGAAEKLIGDKEGMNAFKVMDNEAASIFPGSDGLVFLPYMAGERSPVWDKNAQGVLFGLTYGKTRAHIVRSIMEGVAYSLYHNVNIAKQAKAQIQEFNAMGGAANSRVWTQIKSDVTAIPINAMASDTATTWGAALLAGIGCGIIKDIGAAVKQSIKIIRRHEPDMKIHNNYKQYYDIYIELYEKLKDSMAKISSFGG